MFEEYLVNLECKPLTIDCTRKHRYTPDSIIPGTNILVELKGAFEKDEAVTEQGGRISLYFPAPWYRNREEEIQKRQSQIAP